MRALLLVLTIAGCGNTEISPVQRVALAEPPAAVCPAAPPAVSVPPPPRTFDTVVAFGRDTDARRQQTVRALEVCRKSLEGLMRWIQERGT